MTSYFSHISHRSWLSGVFEHPAFGPLVLALLCALPPAILIVSHYTPIHDTIFWYPLYGYFYETISQGIIPFWNPYSQLGSPFFPMFQALGFLEPSNLIASLACRFFKVNTLSLHLIHIFFQLYAFILGTYLTLNHVTKKNLQSLLFSVILFLGYLPTFMRQNGIIFNFFLLPLTTYFILKFFTVKISQKKGFYLFIIGFFCAVSLNVHYPIVYIMHSVALILLWFIFVKEEPKTTIKFITSGQGLKWIGVTGVVGLMVGLPVLALKYEFLNNSDIFGGIRLFQSIGAPVSCYASDLGSSLIFLDEISHRHALTWYNLFGYILDPIWPLPENPYRCEIRPYVGLIPLLGVFLALAKRRTTYAWLFLCLSLLMLFICFNFSENCYSPGLAGSPLVQRLVITVFPWLRGVEAFQNVAGIFTFDLIILAAIGWCHASKTVKNKILAVAIFLFILKGVAVFFLEYFQIWKAIGFATSDYYYNTQFSTTQSESYALVADAALIPLSLLLVLRYRKPRVVACVLILNVMLVSLIRYRYHVTQDYHFIYLLMKRVCSVTLNQNYDAFILAGSAVVTALGLLLFLRHRWRLIVPILMILDVMLFNIIILKNHVTPDYYQYCEVRGVLSVSRKFSFAQYRDTQFIDKPPYPQEGFETLIRHGLVFGGMYFGKKVDGKFMVKKTGGDQFFMTKSYYDYIANVTFEKQLATSGGIYPILNFFPENAVVSCANKYAVIERINQTSLDDLGKVIFIEKEADMFQPISDVSFIRDEKNTITVSPAHRFRIATAGNKRAPANTHATFSILAYDPNRLSFEVMANEAGWVYYADGFSKYWQAYVNGQPTTIEKTNINFKSIWVPKGISRIDFVYDPVPYRYSLYVACFGYGLFLLILGVVLTKWHVKNLGNKPHKHHRAQLTV